MIIPMTVESRGMMESLPSEEKNRRARGALSREYELYPGTRAQLTEQGEEDELCHMMRVMSIS